MNNKNTYSGSTIFYKSIRGDVVKVYQRNSGDHF